MDQGKKLPVWLFVLPSLLAFSLFIVYFLQIRGEAFARHLVANPLVYDMEAKRILAGEPSGMAFFMSPLYPGFVAFIYKLARPDHLLVPYAQGVLLALNVFVLGLVSRRLVGDIPALVASFVMSLYWSFYYFAGEMVPATLVVTFMLLGVLLFLERDHRTQFTLISVGVAFAAVLFIMRGLPGLADPGGGDAYLACALLAAIFTGGAAVLMTALLASARLRGLANLAAGGLLLGTACLVWGAAIGLAIPLVLILIADSRARLARTCIFLLALCIPLAASFTHNYVASGERVLVTTSFGVNVFIGNNPDSDGMDPFRFGVNDSVKREADRLRLTGAPRSRFFAQHAYRYMREDRPGWLKLVRKKALLSLNRNEIDNNADISERRDMWRRLFLPRLHFGIIFPLALAGIVAAIRRRGDRALPVWGFLVFTAVCVVFFVCERFRLPGVVFLLPLSVAGALLAGRSLAGRLRTALPVIILILAGAAVSNLDFFALADYEFPSIIVNKAYVERLDGRYDMARQFASMAISREPGNAGAHFQLGAMEEAEGGMVAAIGYYLDALALDPFYFASYRAAQRVVEGVGVSTAYVDRYVQMCIEGETPEDIREQITGFVEDRTAR